MNFRKLQTNKWQSGQALLIVLLVMAVTLTVVLSTVSRSVSEVTITGIEENALRAFSAAEAGVEQSLIDQTVGTFGPTAVDATDPSVSYTRVVSEPPETTGRFEYPKELLSGETATFWLVSHEANAGRLTCAGGVPCFSGAASPADQLRFCWGNGATEDSVVARRPAIEVMFYYDDIGNPPSAIASPNNFQNVKVARVAYDLNAASHNNGFNSSVTVGACQIGNRTFTYQSDLAIPASLNACKAVRGCMLMAKVRTYYNTAAIPVGMITTSGNTLAAQGFRIESTGVAAENTSDEATRKVSVFQVYPELPDVFDAAVFSLRNITK